MVFGLASKGTGSDAREQGDVSGWGAAKTASLPVGRLFNNHDTISMHDASGMLLHHSVSRIKNWVPWELTTAAFVSVIQNSPSVTGVWVAKGVHWFKGRTMFGLLRTR